LVPQELQLSSCGGAAAEERARVLRASERERERERERSGGVRGDERGP
jgi:hypothetical protein